MTNDVQLILRSSTSLKPQLLFVVSKRYTRRSMIYIIQQKQRKVKKSSD
jgi:hypothetical protein